MKKQIFNLLIIALILVSSLVFSSFGINNNDPNNPETNEGYTIIRTYEINGMVASKMITAYSDGNIETTPLKGLKAAYFEENIITIQNQLNKLKNNGYELISSNGGSSDNVVVNTYIFQKK